MDKRRIQRLSATSLAATLLALGGFSAGYARIQNPLPATAPEEPAFVGMIAPYTHIRIVREEADSLGISSKELQSIEVAVKPRIESLIKAQKLSWAKDLEWAVLAEQGKVMNASGRAEAGIGPDYERSNAISQPIFENEAMIASEIFNIIGKTRNDKVIAISLKRRKDMWGNAYRILFDPANIEKIGLTEAQQNQMILLQDFWTYMLRHPGMAPQKPFHLEEVLPRAEENRVFLSKQKPELLEDYFEQTRLRLSPVQRVRVRALVNDELYGRP